MSNAPKCPHCGFAEILRSRRRLLERLLPMVRPYRCEMCGRRFYLWHDQQAGAQTQQRQL